MRLMIAGGGGFRVPLVYRALCSGPYSGMVSELVLFDVDASRLAAIETVLNAIAREVGRPPNGGPAVGRSSVHAPAVTSTTSLPHALKGTDVVFAAIRPGGTAGRVADERVARGLGLLGQ
jgi:6-phospho-beta-glucosidase